MTQHTTNYNRWTWLVAILLTLSLVLLWYLGFGGNQSCCIGSKNLEENSATPVETTSEVKEPFHFTANAQSIDTTGDASQAPWLSKGEAIKTFLGTVSPMTLSGDASTATLTGEVDTVVIKEQKGLELQQILGDSVVVDNQLTVKALVEAAAPPVIVPPPDMVKIYFPTAQSTLTEADTASLQASIEWLKSNPNGKATIAGYHDASGIAENNVMIAKSRAQAIYDALIAAGTPSNQLELSQQENMLGDGTYKEARRAEVSVK